MRNSITICSNCVMDNSDEDVIFDNDGRCQRCNEFYERILPQWNYGKGHEKELANLIDSIKREGRNKEYDCLLGLSGGLDSAYLLHLCIVEWKLRPFVLHIDAGFNTKEAENNIKKLTDKLNVELHVVKLDKAEFNDIQIAFLKTGFASLDVPQDHAFIALVDYYALKYKIKYIFNGYNIATEVIADPKTWEKGAGPTGDKVYVKDVIRKLGTINPKKYVFSSGFKHKFVLPYILGVKTVKPLNLLEINKQKMIDVLHKEYGYEYYGQKHFENLLTKLFEGWWLPTKFGYDIRKSQLSSLVITKQITRTQALEILKKPPLTERETDELIIEVASRLEITKEELIDLYNLPATKFKFKNSRLFYDAGIKIFEFFGLEKRIRK